MSIMKPSTQPLWLIAATGVALMLSFQQAAAASSSCTAKAPLVAQANALPLTSDVVAAATSTSGRRATRRSVGGLNSNSNSNDNDDADNDDDDSDDAMHTAASTTAMAAGPGAGDHMQTAAGHHHGHSHGGHYYMHIEVPKKHAYKMGFKRGNHKHEIERKESVHKEHVHSYFKWHDKKGKGSHKWIYKHHDKKHGHYGRR